MKKLFQMVMVLFASSTVFADTAIDRIASVDANATEILIGLGLREHLVAVDVTSLSLVNDPNLPDLGYHRALSAEGVLSTSPSLVIGSTHMGPPPVVKTLQSSSIPLVQLEAADSIAGLISNIEELGTLVEQPGKADAIIQKVTADAELIEAQVKDEKTMVFLLNMSGRGLSKAGHGTTGEALIHLLGGANLSEYGGYKTVSMEALLELNPDVILVGSGRTQTDAAADLLKDNPLLAHSNAVKNNRFLNVDSNKMVAGVSLGVVEEAKRLSLLLN